MAAVESNDMMSAAEYSASVEQWLHQAYHWQIFALGFPSYLAYQASVQAQQNLGALSGRVPSHPGGLHSVGGVAAGGPRLHRGSPPVFQVFTIPPIWKRFVAELIDFLTLFVLKLFITYIAIDSLELFDVESFFRKHDRSLYLLAAGKEIDVEDAFELTSDIVLLEIIHRFVVCIFEILCTFKGPAAIPGGATPGKLLMGLRIYKCDNIVMTDVPGRVQISPASNLGLFWASVRSVLKNTAVALLFPVCITFLFMPGYRTLYDVMSKSIVVEVDIESLRRQRNPEVARHQ
ncbi:protein FAM8A1-like [Tigriopus californicus]|uniref:protein FAM8A1-like n=1 Tax=Tigriopus californicus TaxID=6832 RepID=UPI0027DA5FB1|nr:protein FAM8A1-like [Tigriopus californicus]